MYTFVFYTSVCLSSCGTLCTDSRHWLRIFNVFLRINGRQKDVWLSPTYWWPRSSSFLITLSAGLIISHHYPQNLSGIGKFLSPHLSHRKLVQHVCLWDEYCLKIPNGWVEFQTYFPFFLVPAANHPVGTCIGAPDLRRLCMGPWLYLASGNLLQQCLFPPKSSVSSLLWWSKVKEGQWRRQHFLVCNCLFHFLPWSCIGKGGMVSIRCCI